jgi:hypothetical protein
MIDSRVSSGLLRYAGGGGGSGEAKNNGPGDSWVEDSADGGVDERGGCKWEYVGMSLRMSVGSLAEEEKVLRSRSSRVWRVEKGQRGRLDSRT